MERRWVNGLGPRGASLNNPEYVRRLLRPRWFDLTATVVFVASLVTLGVTASLLAGFAVLVAGVCLLGTASVLIIRRRWPRLRIRSASGAGRRDTAEPHGTPVPHPPLSRSWWLRPMSRKERRVNLLFYFGIAALFLPLSEYWTIGFFFGGWVLYVLSIVLLYLRHRKLPAGA